MIFTFSASLKVGMNISNLLFIYSVMRDLMSENTKN
jgi:hypothetical protein